LPLQNKKIKTSGIEFTGFCRKIRVVFYRFCQSREKVAKLHNKIKNQSTDFFRTIVDDNQIMVAEDLNVKGMCKNEYFAQSRCIME